MRSALIVLSRFTSEPYSVRGILHMAREMAKHGVNVEVLALSTGIEVFRKNGEYADLFGPLLRELQGLGIRLAACTNAMKTAELTKDDMFPADLYVIGGQEVIARSRYGYQILTF
ncbi:DsrE family protein [Sulfobacillus thermosulfidooxidans]|uniref:DsrE/DsrF-like family protein n=2 Tax=Sulfobacillus thermosulfidooxidans TaxID=28034 RepID=A0A1W1WH70_SULTA|nr:DsrE family protein [Sulfobacillus thermosulfidooxidans]OLZ08068.1 hypothetical protein BFX05_04610 [Sulfobacillus thermosulfidooxidans]OLZ16482.1 hypothetical protein BFX06_14995 [Sulfobacillus thermosulfidooxidans]OLZ19569.1 hypothetical protein BFX07_02570 [Sulfobacillus thermosulfidooxidans]PSR26870.1 MAG: hypothetical protein C7B47_09785 [Sulfobacillus thermosulfidooxidans]SMC05617.1 DsrE/DsrF-like family protein [Sulfobacillus thermosulfidooxidans DSM 9293]